MNQELIQHFNNYGAVYSVLGGLIVIAQISLVLAQMMRGFGQQQRQMQLIEHHETERRAIEAQQLDLERQRDAAWQKERAQEAAELAQVRAARSLLSDANDLFQRIKQHQA